MARHTRTTTNEIKTDKSIQYTDVLSPRKSVRTEGPTEEQIAKRAYELFQARGSEHGHEMEDWLQAERELRLGRFN